MIKEEFVEMETAKLLKEAGLPQELDSRMMGYVGVPNGEAFIENAMWLCVEDAEYIAAPTQAQAMRWLREVHHINIRVNWHSKRQQWFFDMLDIANIYDYFESEDYLPTYEAAAEAGIQAACQYLIQNNQHK